MHFAIFCTRFLTWFVCFFIQVLYNSGTIVKRIKDYLRQNIWNPVMLVSILLLCIPGIVISNIGTICITVFCFTFRNDTVDYENMLFSLFSFWMQLRYSLRPADRTALHIRWQPSPHLPGPLYWSRWWWRTACDGRRNNSFWMLGRTRTRLRRVRVCRGRRRRGARWWPSRSSCSSCECSTSTPCRSISGQKSWWSDAWYELPPDPPSFWLI